MADENQYFQQLVESMKKGAKVLREAEIPFLLGGGLACWARGGPESEHDVDFLLRPDDAERALEAFKRAGLRTERPPEDWLYKSWVDETMIDLIFRPSGKPVTDELFERGEELEVSAVRMQVASLEDVLVTKLLAVDEQDLDYGPVVEIARSLREQIDWRSVREQTRDSPYAKAFFTLIEELRIVEAGGI
jgi:hypothetical protein